MNSTNWKYRKIGNVVQIRRGASPRPIDDYVGNYGMPWVKISDATADKGRFVWSTALCIKEEGVPKSVVVNPGELIISNSATPGLPKIMKIKACIHDGWLKVDKYNGITRDFLYYSIKHHVKRLVIQGNGSIFTNLKTDILKDFPIPVPDSIQEQEQIAKVLSIIEDRIELNNKINAELEARAKLVYDYWFVQFDFPDKDNKPYKSSGGKLVWSEELKRDIPEGWEVFNLASLIKESKNGDWGSESMNEGLTKCFCIRGADINGLNGTENFDPPVRYIDKSHINRQLNSDDLIIEISGGSPIQSTGRMAHISSDVLVRLVNGVVCSNFCKAISLKNSKLSYAISRYWTHLYDSGTFFNYEGKTSGIKNLLFDQLVKDVKIPLPIDETLVNQYSDLEEKLDKQKQNNLIQNKELAELRDWLLPMLMNGQVKVT